MTSGLAFAYRRILTNLSEGRVAQQLPLHSRFPMERLPVSRLLHVHLLVVIPHRPLGSPVHQGHEVLGSLHSQGSRQ